VLQSWAACAWATIRDGMRARGDHQGWDACAWGPSGMGGGAGRWRAGEGWRVVWYGAWDRYIRGQHCEVCTFLHALCCFMLAMWAGSRMTRTTDRVHRRCTWMLAEGLVVRLSGKVWWLGTMRRGVKSVTRSVMQVGRRAGRSLFGLFVFLRMRRCGQAKRGGACSKRVDAHVPGCRGVLGFLKDCSIGVHFIEGGSHMGVCGWPAHWSLLAWSVYGHCARGRCWPGAHMVTAHVVAAGLERASHQRLCILWWQAARPACRYTPRATLRSTRAEPAMPVQHLHVPRSCTVCTVCSAVRIHAAQLVVVPRPRPPCSAHPTLLHGKLHNSWRPGSRSTAHLGGDQLGAHPVPLEPELVEQVGVRRDALERGQHHIRRGRKHAAGR